MAHPSHDTGFVAELNRNIYIAAVRSPSAVTSGFIVAVLCTGIINLPLWHALLFTEEAHLPDVVLQNGDEAFYLARIREVGDGHPAMGQPFLFERRDEPYGYGHLAELLLGSVMRITGLSLKMISILGDSVGVFLLVLAAWFALGSLLPDWRWRTLAVAWFFLGANLFIGQRTVSPQLNLIPVFVYLLALFHSKREQTRWCLVRAGMIGLLFYMYPYYWTYCISAEALLLLWSLYQLPDWSSRVRRAFWTAIPILLLALPWLISSWAQRGDPVVAEMLARLGLIRTRWPKGPIHQLQAVLVMAAIAVVLRVKPTVRGAVPLLAFVGATLIVFNQAIITNAELEFSNHYSIISRIAVQIAVIWLLANLTERYRLAKIGVGITIGVLVFVQTVTWQTDVWRQFQTYAQSERRGTLLSVIDTLNTLPPEQVVVTPSAFATNIAIYTSHYPFLSNATRLMPVSDRELVTRARVMRQLFPNETVSERTVVGTHHINLAVHERIACQLFNVLPGREADCKAIQPALFLPPAWQEFLTATALTSDELYASLKERHVSYILVETAPASLAPRLEPMETSGSYQLYRLL